MSIEEKLDIMEVLFHKAIIAKYPSSIEFSYNLYNDYYTKHQEYIWYHNLDTGVNYVRDTYGKYKQDRK